MGARYPDQLGGHKPCVPVVVVAGLSPFGTAFVLPRRWSLVSLVGTGPPMTYPRGEFCRSGRESVMAID